MCRTYRERYNAWKSSSSKISRIYTTCWCSSSSLRSRIKKRIDRIQMDRRPDRTVRGSRRSRQIHLWIWGKLRIPCRTICTWQRCRYRIYADLWDGSLLQKYRQLSETETGRDLCRVRTLPQQDRQLWIPWTQWNGQDVWNHAEPAWECTGRDRWIQGNRSNRLY